MKQRAFVGLEVPFQEIVDGVLDVADSHDSHTFVSEREIDNFLNGGRIVGK